MFQPCDGDPAQRWMASTSGSVHVVGTDTAIGSDGYEHGGMCIDFATDSPYARLQVWQCWDGSPNQVRLHGLRRTMKHQCDVSALASSHQAVVCISPTLTRPSPLGVRLRHTT